MPWEGRSICVTKSQSKHWTKSLLLPDTGCATWSSLLCLVNCLTNPQMKKNLGTLTAAHSCGAPACSALEFHWDFLAGMYGQ